MDADLEDEDGRVVVRIKQRRRDPSRQEIADMCLAIQRAWTDDERQQRRRAATSEWMIDNIPSGTARAGKIKRRRVCMRLQAIVAVSTCMEEFSAVPAENLSVDHEYWGFTS